MPSLAGELSIDLSSLDPSADLVVWADIESKSEVRFLKKLRKHTYCVIRDQYELKFGLKID